MIVVSACRLRSIRDDSVPSTINVETLGEDCDLNCTVGEAVDREVTVALTNASGFGGHNTTLAFTAVEAGR